MKDGYMGNIPPLLQPGSSPPGKPVMGKKQIIGKALPPSEIFNTAGKCRKMPVKSELVPFFGFPGAQMNEPNVLA
jgi:hypothetical protein